MSNLIKDIQRSVDFRRLPNTDRPNPSGFISYEWVAAAALNAHALIFRHECVHVASRHHPLLPWIACRHVVETNGPFLHISTDLLQAFLATNPPEHWEWRMPYHSFIINLPKASIKTDEWAVNAIIVACPKEVARWHMEDMCGEQRLESFHETRRIFIGDVSSNLCIIGLCSDNGQSYLHQTWERAVNAAGGLPDELIDNFYHEHAQSLEGHGVIRCPVTEQLCRVALNTITSLTTSPEIVTEEAAAISQSKGFGACNGMGVIRWIGRDFKRRISHCNELGDGSTKAPHWRRGHWHTVLHGAKRALRKLQWFQPVYVNGQAAE